MADDSVIGVNFAGHELEQLELIVRAFERVPPSAHKRIVEYLDSRFNAGRLLTIERAAIIVLNGLNKRIENAPPDRVPVFTGVVDLNNALNANLLQKAQADAG